MIYPWFPIDHFVQRKAITLQTGPFGSQLHSYDYVATGVPVVPTEAIRGRRIDRSALPYVSMETAERLSRHQLVLNDILFARRGAQATGQSAIVRQEDAGAICGTGAIRLRVSPVQSEIDATFLSHYLTSPEAVSWIKSQAIGATMPNLNEGIIRRIPIPLPSFSEQRLIASALDGLDDKIELNRRMNETLEAMAQAIFRDWFVDFGPTRRKLEGATDPITIMGGLVQDTERAQALADLFPAALGDDGLPEGWTERAFGAFVEIIGGGTPKTSNERYWNGSIPWFSVTDTPPKGSIFVEVTEKTISEEGLANSSARLVRAGTTIISARGTVGNLALTPHEMTFNQSCYGLQGNAAVGDCFVFLAAQNIVERLKGMAHGSVFSTITRSTFDNIQLAYTPEEIFEAFESLARPMFDKVLGNVKESRTLAATRHLLLPKLMSGEIRLQSAENPIEVRV